MRKKTKLTNKQTDFIQAYCTPGSSGYNNATQAMIIAGYSERTASHCVFRMLSNAVIKDRIVRYRADLAAESEFTRKKQLKDLEDDKQKAKLAGQFSASISATREQNEMLGYHRDLAPNLEKEQAKRELLESEERELERLTKLRVAELSTGRTHRIGS